ncbi:MAG: hypothetical protein ACK5Q5_14030 [Planctomycetaceae bacterium]
MHRFVLLTVVTCLGCGGSAGLESDGSKLYPVTAIVTVDGKPESGVSVTLVPKDTKDSAGGVGGGGASGADGKVVFRNRDGREGMPAGTYSALINWVRLPDGGPVPPDAMPESVGARNLLSKEFESPDTTPYTVIVTEGENEPVKLEVTRAGGRKK